MTLVLLYIQRCQNQNSTRHPQTCVWYTQQFDRKQPSVINPTPTLFYLCRFSSSRSQFKRVKSLGRNHFEWRLHCRIIYSAIPEWGKTICIALCNRYDYILRYYEEVGFALVEGIDHFVCFLCVRRSVWPLRATQPNKTGRTRWYFVLPGIP